MLVLLMPGGDVEHFVGIADARIRVLLSVVHAPPRATCASLHPILDVLDAFLNGAESLAKGGGVILRQVGGAKSEHNGDEG